MALFPLGKLYSTHGVAELQGQEPGFVEYVWNCLKRYKRGDWGDMTGNLFDPNHLLAFLSCFTLFD